MGLPPVVVGLIVYLLSCLSFGVLGLLFTVHAMVIAQVIIITPLITSIAHHPCASCGQNIAISDL